MYIGERFPSFFFWTCHGKVILELKRAMSKFSNIFSCEKPKTFRLKKKSETKITGSSKGEKNKISKVWFNSCYPRKYKSMKIEHQQVLWTKRQKWLELSKLLCICPQNLLMLYFHGFVFLVVTRFEPNPWNLVMVPFSIFVSFLFNSSFSTGRFRLFAWKNVAKFGHGPFQFQNNFSMASRKKIKNEGKRSSINILCSPWKFFSYCVKKKRFWKKITFYP